MPSDGCRNASLLLRPVPTADAANKDKRVSEQNPYQSPSPDRAPPDLIAARRPLRPRVMIFLVAALLASNFFTRGVLGPDSTSGGRFAVQFTIVMTACILFAAWQRLKRSRQR